MNAARRFVLASVVAVLAATPLTAGDLEIEAPAIVFSGTDLELEVAIPDGSSEVRLTVDGVEVGQWPTPGPTVHLTVPAEQLGTGLHVLEIATAGAEANAEVRAIPGWWSVLPPLLAIGLALAFKDVILSLYAGLLLGSLMLAGWHPISAFARTVDHFMKNALSDGDRISIILFSMLLGGMVGVISKSGGTQGIVARLSGLATSVRRGQVAGWLMGIVIFFDDYANTLIVGPTMRPLTDKLRISREKLAYIVDSTAAPIASLIPISTWVGYEVGLIAVGLSAVGLELNAYAVFVETIPFRFYPIFALAMVLIVAVTGRDLGPMLQAERRARTTGAVIADGDMALADYSSNDLLPPEGTVIKARNALLPILTVIGVTLAGIFVSGRSAVGETDLTGGALLREIFGNGDSYGALMWASLSGAVLAMTLAKLQARLPLRSVMDGFLAGFKSMLLALVVLVLAWSLGDLTGELRTADFVVALTEGNIAPAILPSLVFVVSAAVAFATGTSWATMAILVPLVIPVMHNLAVSAGHAAGSTVHHTLLLGAISSILAGSVWGDHCSPISDTTILSSMASGCDHIAHVRTQMPYALSLGLLGILLGDIPTAMGLSPWISLAVGIAVIYAVVRWRGQVAGQEPNAI